MLGMKDGGGQQNREARARGGELEPGEAGKVVVGDGATGQRDGQ